jgi:glutaredoxin-like protein NrdH
MKFVKVFSKEKCMQCKMVKNWLTAKGIEFTETNVSQDKEALNELQSLGFTSVPVTYIDTDNFNGYLQGFDIMGLRKHLEK